MPFVVLHFFADSYGLILLGAEEEGCDISYGLKDNNGTIFIVASLAISF